jgi:NAD(P)-dependent dehydrogenase (short-subunit alcohol dehydrogenase family)
MQFKVHGLSGDVSSEPFVQQLAARVHAEHGGANVLVNNAGISMIAAAEDTTAAQWRRVMDVNLLGPFLTCKYLGSQMLARRRGSIVTWLRWRASPASPPQCVQRIKAWPDRLDANSGGGAPVACASMPLLPGLDQDRDGRCRARPGLSRITTSSTAYRWRFAQVADVAAPLPFSRTVRKAGSSMA